MNRDQAKDPGYVTIVNGVLIKPNMLIDELTLRERRNYLADGFKNTMTRDEARRAGYSNDEIRKEFDDERI